jgi:hypothetical protein
MRVCYKCGATLQERARVPFKELCPQCEAFLHCCMNCRLYAPDRPNHCLSTTTEFVPDAERGNFCEEFHFLEKEDPKPKAEAKPAPSMNEESRKPKAAANGSNGRPLSAREKFDQLFKK